MTVVAKMPDGKIKVLCKGADSMIQARLSQSNLNNDLNPMINAALDAFANTGLRTLLLCEKEISLSEYKDFSEQYKTASQTMFNRDEEMEAVADRLEREFEVIGATAIEDKL
jgi:magnesium-transporting ATPase (P-type)